MRSNPSCAALAVLASAAMLTNVAAHPDDPKQRRAADDPEIALANGGYSAVGIDLLAQVTLAEFGAQSWANDCWGYTSGSGREYAIIGLQSATGFVEITNPASPVIIDVISGPSGTWRDIKVYQDYAYVVSESGSGIQVMPLADIDNGNIGTVTTVTTGGSVSTHNVALNEDSGFLYRCGGSGLRVYDLSNPAVPLYVNAWNGKYVHDAQIVSYTSGPFAGREIAFLCAGFSGGGNQTGLTILDVTDKQNMFTMAPHLQYPDAAYSHQGWLSEDRQYFFLGDEQDEFAGLESTVHIIDVSDLTSPFYAGAFANGLTSVTHNLYVRGNQVYAANYSTGLRIFDASDPLNMVEVGFFDTYPSNDALSFNGLWSNYPFFPSGTIIGSDSAGGLFIMEQVPLTLGFDFPNGRPSMLSPVGEQIVVEISALTADPLDVTTAMLHLDTGGGFVATPLNHVSAGTFTADFPDLPCAIVATYYFTAGTIGGSSGASPPTAPTSDYEGLVGNSIIDVYVDDFEADLGWTTSFTGATSGFWERGVPVDDPGYAYDPASDSDGSGQCFLTQNQAGESDVDGGYVTLTSPLLDMSGGDLILTYDYFLRITGLSDGIQVLYSSNGDAGPFIPITAHTTDGGLSWRHVEYTPAELLALGVTFSSTMKFRFNALDGAGDDIVEAGLDAFKLKKIDCSLVLGDLNGDGLVGIADLFIMFGEWGPCDLPCPPSCLADLDEDCQVGITDLFILFGSWG